MQVHSKQLGPKLSDSHAALLASHNPCPQLLLDKDNHFIGCNPSFYSSFPELKLEKNDLVFSGDSLGFAPKAIADLLHNSQQLAAVDRRLQNRNGRWFQIYARQSQQKHCDRCTVLSFFEITDLVCDLEKTRESEMVYRTFVEHSHGIVFRSTLDFRPYFFHGACKNLTGYPEEDFATGHLRWDDIIVAEDRKKRLAANQEMASKPSGEREFEYRITRKDGEQRWVRELVHNICDADDHPLWLQGTIFDISENKRANQKLSELQDRFRLAFHTNPDAIYINRLSDGRYVDVNEGFCSLSGYRRKEVIGQSDLDIKIWQNPQDRKRFARLLVQNSVLRNFETTFVLKNGSGHAFQTSAALINLRDEVHVLSISRDVEELKQAQEKQRELLATVQQAQKLESLGLLAGGIAHDFNNILVGILGNLDLLTEKLDHNPQLLELALNTEKAAQQAAALTQQMLAFSGKAVFDVRSTSLDAIIGDMGQLLKVAAGHQAQLQLDLADDVPLIDADVTQIHQVILNLVSNASEAIGERSGHIIIKTEKGVLGDQQAAVLQVIDDGAGIASDDLDKIFEPYYTTKFTGRGLGLAAVQGIIKGHNGQIKVHSQNGQGATFSMHFPKSKRPQQAVKKEKEYSQGRFIGQGRVLLIDDDPVVLEVGERMLRAMGFTVLCADSGQRGIKLFEENKSDIVCAIVDLTMPVMSGEQTVSLLRDINPKLPILISSGYTAQNLDQEIAQHPLTSFIQKPYRRAKLANKLSELLAKISPAPSTSIKT